MQVNIEELSTVMEISNQKRKKTTMEWQQEIKFNMISAHFQRAEPIQIKVQPQLFAKSTGIGNKLDAQYL